jgi:hypothetical protein
MRSRCSAAGMTARGAARRPSPRRGRVDDQRLVQLARGAGEAAEHQHAALRSSRAATNSLHTRFMPSCRLVTTQTSAARNSSVTASCSWCSPAGAPAGSRGVAEAGVDAGRGGATRSWKRGTRRARCASARPPARRRSGRSTRMLLEQPLHRIDALEDALGVVEAVHAHAMQCRRAGPRRSITRRRHSATSPSNGGHGLVVRPLDRDRVALHQRLLAAEGVMVDARARCAPRGSGRPSR